MLDRACVPRIQRSIPGPGAAALIIGKRLFHICSPNEVLVVIGARSTVDGRAVGYRIAKHTLEGNRRDILSQLNLEEVNQERYRGLMKTRPRLVLPAAILVALLVGLVAFTAVAADDVDVRKGGSHWARIASGGEVRIDGRIVGKIEQDGSVRVGGSIAGRVEGDGAIRDGGSIAGRVEKDGTLRRGGTIIGRIEDGGAIRRNGSIWGSASPCCASFDDRRQITALLFFFDRGFFSR